MKILHHHIAPRGQFAQLLKKSAWLLHQIGSTCTHIKSTLLSSHQERRKQLVFEVGLSIQEEAMDVARSAPQGAHYHVDVIIYFLNREKGGTIGLMVARVRFSCPTYAII